MPTVLGVHVEDFPLNQFGFTIALKCAAFVKQQTPPFITLRDRAHQLVSQVKVPVMPTCYLLGRDGRVRFVHAGFHGAKTDQEIRHELDLLIAEPLPSP